MNKLVNLQHKVAERILGPDVDRADGRCRFAPEWVVLCVNNFCNLKCRMCDVGLGERASVFYANMIGDNPGNMSLDLLKTILDSAAQFRPLPKIGLAFTEPLNHVHIVEFCREIVSRGFYCSITSNGYLLPQRAEALVEIGVDELTISVDGPAHIHDVIRGRKGSFARLYEGIEKINMEKERTGRAKPFIGISTTVTDLSYLYLTDLLRELAPLRPGRVNVAHLSFITPEMVEAHNSLYSGEMSVAESSIGEMDLRSIDVALLAEKIAEARDYAATHNPAIPLTFHPELKREQELARYYHQPEQYVGGRHCTDIFKMMMVKTDGTVIPAHSRCYNYPLGNVQDTPLPQLWNNARYLAFRSLIRTAGGSLPACTRCCGVVGKSA